MSFPKTKKRQRQPSRFKIPHCPLLVQRTLKQLTTVLILCVFLVSCQKTYYTALEKVGIHKRDILVSRVEKARNAQAETKEQFATALEKFKATVQFDGGELERQYNELKDEFDTSQSKAKTVKARIDDVENVAKALFEEWQTELKQYSNANLRQASQQKLDQTNQRYQKLIQTMRRAESKIAPVLATFQDQVLFLKHNLNARAIATLDKELVTIQTDVDNLIREMEDSIQEADAFLDALQ